MRVVYTLLGFLLAGLPARAAPVPPFPEVCRLVRLAALPMTFRHGHLLVAVKLNGQPFNFTVDTGGFVSVISPAAIARLGLATHPIRDDIKLGGAGGGEMTRYARIDAITIGTARLQNLTFAEADLGDGEDGILSPEILRGFDVDFDFDQNVFSLFKPHACSDHIVYWTDDYARIPFTVTDQGHIRLEVGLDGKPVQAMLDTGSPTTLVRAQKLKTVLPAIAAPTDPGVGLKGLGGGQFSAVPATFDNMALGKFIWSKPTLLVASEDFHRSDGADMLLGLRELYGLHLFIDYRSRYLYVSRRLPGQ